METNDRTPVQEDARHWHLDQIRAREAWRYAEETSGRARGCGIRIGIPDTGIIEHPSIVGAVNRRWMWDVLTRRRDASETRRPFPLNIGPNTLAGHGTAVASIAVGRLGTEVEGVAPEAELVAVRCDYFFLQVLDTNIANAVNFLRSEDIDCHVLSISMGGWGLDGARASIRAAVENGIIVVAAAGNGGMWWPRRLFRPFVASPGVYPEVIAVASSTGSGRPATGSCRADTIEIAAPGEQVLVAVPSVKGGRRLFDGTSVAAPQVAAAAALWLAHHGRDELIAQYGKHRLQDVFRYQLRQTAYRPFGWPRGYGAGILDAEALLREDLPDLSVVPHTSTSQRLEGLLPRTFHVLSSPAAALWHSKYRYRFVGGLYDPGARIATPGHASLGTSRHRSALQTHADFFDLNGDGVVTIREAARALRMLGYGTAPSYFIAAAICLAVGWLSWKAPPLLALTFNADAAFRGTHFGSSRVFGDDGHFDGQRFSAVFGDFGHLTEQDIHELLERFGSERVAGTSRLKRTFGRLFSRFELEVLRRVVGKRRPGRTERVLARDQLARFYRGGFFQETLHEAYTGEGHEESTASLQGEGPVR